MMPISNIRVSAERDAPEIARLFTELGHASTDEDVRNRWERFHAAGNQAMVAERADGSLAGVLTLSRMLVLHRPRPVGRISTLVVDEPDRGAGIGRALVEAAEKLLAEAGCGLIEVTSNLRLTEAHGFYEHLGYAKTSYRLAKTIEAEEGGGTENPASR